MKKRIAKKHWTPAQKIREKLAEGKIVPVTTLQMYTFKRYTTELRTRYAVILSSTGRYFLVEDKEGVRARLPTKAQKYFGPYAIAYGIVL